MKSFIPEYKICAKCGRMYGYEPGMGYMIFDSKKCPECIKKEMDKWNSVAGKIKLRGKHGGLG